MNSTPFVMWVHLMRLMQSGGDLTQLLNPLEQQNPQIAQARQMLSGRRPRELQQIAQNLAQQKGIDLNQFIRGLGVR